jgi:hypothetical protein
MPFKWMRLNDPPRSVGEIELLKLPIGSQYDNAKEIRDIL